MAQTNQTTKSGHTIVRMYEPGVRQVLEKWAWWRRSGRLGAEVGWPRKTITGKFLEGMPGTTCPTCHGKGQIPAARFRIARVMLVCPTCKGEGRVLLDKTDPEKINPAYIRSTYRGQEDQTMVVVDRLVCELRQSPKTEKHYYVLWSEYVSHKYETQEWKAGKLGIKHGYYRKLLHETHAMIERGLQDSGIYLETAHQAS
jgi:hypothetical protein